jgi:hypothetical protein
MATWNEGKVFSRLAAVFPSPAFTLLPQVRNGTGYSRNRTRTADAIAVSTWPSRGLYFAGVEIKVSRSDWRKELASPDKAAELQKYCRYWYVAAPEGVVPLGEVPETWGCIEVGRSAAIVKPAPELPAVPPDMLLVCSIMRTLAEVTVPACDVAERINEATAKAKEAFEKRRSYDVDRLRQSVAMFEAASGVSLTDTWEAGDIGAAVKFVRETGVLKARAVIERLRNEAASIVSRLDKAMTEESTAK